MEKRTGWFADIDREAPDSHPWQPCFDTAESHIPCFQIWFATKRECEQWIRETVLGAGMLDD